MATFIARRAIQAVIVIVLVSMIVFFAVRLLPGNPALMLQFKTEVAQITEEMLTQLRSELGLDKPLTVQYYNWISGLLRGDLGKSLQWKTPVMKEITSRLPVSLHLGLLAFVCGIIFGIALGLISAIKRGSLPDTVVTTFANIGITVPVFWLAHILYIYFPLSLTCFQYLATSPL